MKNLCAKMRSLNDPYEIWISQDGRWEWRVLKKNQADDNKLNATWYCAVKSPFTGGIYEYGDEFVETIKKGVKKNV